MIVMKFGGTSVATPEAIEKTIAIVREARQREGTSAVVCSAFGGVTNGLIRLAQLATSRDEAMAPELKALQQRHRDAVQSLVPEQWREEAGQLVESMLTELAELLHGVQLLREASPRSIDFLMSFGERLSCLIVSYAMRSSIADAVYLDARKVIRTDNAFGLAQVEWDTTCRLIQEYFSVNPGLQIVTGFIASSSEGFTTTLGRGGSDYTASILGAALAVDEIQIWTDVSGVLTADPRKVPNTKTVPFLSYEEATEVAHFGAKVIYPPTMAPAMRVGVPIRIKNTFEPDAPGSLIGTQSSAGGTACGITSIDDVVLLQLKGTGLIGVAGSASRLFGSLARAGVSVILISQASSEHSICFAIKPEHAKAALQAVSTEFEFEINRGSVEKIALEEELSIIAVVGEGMRDQPGISGRIFSSLGRHGVNVEAIAQGSSELNVSLVVKQKDERRALRILHEAFFVSHRVTRVFLVGYGLIGKALLQQLRDLEACGKSIPGMKVCALANSKKMVADEQGLDLALADELLEQGSAVDLEGLLTHMKRWPNSILVDCTAGNVVCQLYPEALAHGVSVVTPNKIANTGRYEDWLRLQDLSLLPDVEFCYEANVGAGLPVIGTLRDLLSGGDEVLRIEAVLSGTLSYLFNTFALGTSFSELLVDAKAQGYTEPDPRDDLSGTDVARKILILARESGLALELADVAVENLVPEPLRALPTSEAFLNGLPAYEDTFGERLRGAHSRGNVLRYIATLENGKASVGLQEVGPDHPCANIAGSDNIVSFTTRRYRNRPLVVKGPGAGAEVTAAQNLAEILRIAKQKR